MALQRKKTMINLVLAMLLVLLCLAALPAPGTAHIVSTTTFSAALPVEEESSPANELLCEAGQNVKLSYLDSLRDIEIPFTVPANTGWYVTVTSNNESLFATGTVSGIEETVNLTVEGLENTVFYTGSGAKSVLLSLQNFLPQELNEDNTVVAVSNPMVAEVHVEVTYITLPAMDEETYDPTQTLSAAQAAVGTLSADFFVPLQMQSAVPRTGTLLYWTRQYHPETALLLMNGAAESEVQLLNAKFPAMTQYHLDGETYVLYDAASVVIPAGATVTLDFSRVSSVDLQAALASAAELEVTEETSEEAAADETNAAEEALLSEETETDVSEETGESGEETSEQDGTTTEEQDGATTEEEPVETAQKMVLLAGGREYPVELTQLPELEQNLVMSGSAMILPVSYKWDGATPHAVVEKLHRVGNTVYWEQETTPWVVGEAGTGIVVSAQETPEAGTYRLTLIWSQNELPLCSAETVFFVRNGFAG